MTLAEWSGGWMISNTGKVVYYVLLYNKCLTFMHVCIHIQLRSSALGSSTIHYWLFMVFFKSHFLLITHSWQLHYTFFSARLSVTLTLEELLVIQIDSMKVFQLSMVSNNYRFMSHHQICVYYARRRWVHNVHLCYLPVCVSDWGPLCGYSCFPFESVNGRLKTHYHGTRSMNKQLGFSYIVLQLLPKSVEKEPKMYVHIYIIYQTLVIN